MAGESREIRGSIIGFKKSTADLHRLSPYILTVSLVLSAAVTAVLLTGSWMKEAVRGETVEKPPIVIQIEDIPETIHRVQAPAPKLSIPLEVDDDFMPDDITIENTDLDLAEVSTPSPPPSIDIALPEGGVEAAEDEIFEYFSVEEKPRRLTTVIPRYPEMAERAGIEGTVYLKLLIAKTGDVDSVIVVKGPEIFQSSAIEASKKTRFSPAKNNDKPVPCWVILPFTFKMEK
ncbi:MAG: energy transducer TonB [Candidatus Latescibacteria bacterium]|nr:energy transducer TonB [Candidatus Latescibacterota bacterium]